MSIPDVENEQAALPQPTEDFVPEVADGEAEPEAQESVVKKKKKPVAVGYRVLSAVLLLLSILGLFAGALGKLIPSLAPFATYRIADDTNAFGYTLLGRIIYTIMLMHLGEVAESVISFSLHNAGDVILFIVLMLAVISVIVCLITALIAFCSGKRAKTCTQINATSLFLGYGMLFLYNFAIASPLLGVFYKMMFDLSSGIIAGIALVILITLVFIDKRTTGGTTKEKLLNLTLLILTYGCLFLFFVPNTGTSYWSVMTIPALNPPTMEGIALCTLFALFAFNFFATAVRFHFKKSYLVDTVRYGLQLFAVAFVLITAIAFSPDDRLWIFKGNTLITVAMIIAAFVLFLIPLIKVISVAVRKNKANKALEDAVALEDVEDEDQPVIELPPITTPEPAPMHALPEPSPEHLYQPQGLDVDAIFGSKREDRIDPNEQYLDEFVTEMIQSEETETMFEPTNEPNQTLSDEVNDEPLQEEEVIVFTADNFDPNNPIIFGATSDPGGMIGGNASFFAGSMPAAEKPVEKEEKKKVIELTDFEKEMASKAKEPIPTPEQTVITETDPRYPFMTQTVTNPPAGQQAAQPIIQQTFITPSAQPQTPAPAPERIERPERYERPDYYERPERVYDSQFTYDPFINTLTPDERSEFGDVFISHRHGIQNYLPTYVIGGDNKEFFSLLFIQLGHYRKFISQALMDKMYAFVSHR